jgi:serine/threonine protein kinase
LLFLIFNLRLSLNLDFVQGVQFLHQKRIIHNDIALRNIVICRKTKNLYIIDFSEAEFLQANTESEVKEELHRLGSSILEMAKVLFRTSLNGICII